MMKTITTKRFRFLQKTAGVFLALALSFPFLLLKANAAPVSGQNDGTAIVRQETELPSDEVDSLAYQIFSKRELILSFMILYAVIQLLCHEKRPRKIKTRMAVPRGKAGKNGSAQDACRLFSVFCILSS